ncbi:hypothetical protein JX265_001914 [Neoarthrinium moseri]|uniref:Uncharacterized protein n=1 Tax=Neoarthrinium moseri TaxID=1658444 RepID=A0A9Q0AV21_9PEZI|nr:uncharacterized protein JN550_005664 [Neoarthrinium moseri]KAI1847908.1 hypothetical protein JX266_006021 [Neoarthrinium moseri]KAI1869683.1 hypothetical protein JN550_005664 [Neoarthrinium moseri]KAI1880293.1 hypothetical protein JX265_001914 [Neoarthrinium moseri]
MAEKKVVLITGANTGLGYQIVRALFGSNEAYEILLGGRSIQKAEQAVNDVTAEFPSSKTLATAIQVDIEDDASIEAAFQKVQSTYGKLDFLVNNAGAQLDPLFHAGKMTMREMWNASWNVNTVGTQIITTAFVPLLLKSSDPRLLFITSGTSTLAGSENRDLPINKVAPKGWPKPSHHLTGVPAYRSSKTGMNMMMREWYRTLKEDGVKVWCISPGYLATGLGGSQEQNKAFGAGDPAVAGSFVKAVLEGMRDEDVGKVILRDSVQPW